jgi:hypothetical protein
VWQAALLGGGGCGIPTHADVAHFDALVHEACCQPLLADRWVLADCQLVEDSEQFFLFADVIR